MKNILILLSFILILTGCGQPITKEEESRLKSSIQRLNQEEVQARDNYVNAQRELSNQLSTIRNLESQINESKVKLGILKSGRSPIYILKLKFQEHKFELSMDRISFEFEIPVDERFYNESEIGKELGSGSRSFSFGHNGDIKIVDKRIQ